MTKSTSNSANSGVNYVIGFVTSKDGTRIGYRQYGAGPAVALVQGAIGTTQSYHELASNLANDFAVYVPERRGRPLSPHAYAPDHVVQRDVEDLEALFEHSGAHFLFGLSSGAVIALEAARVLPSIHKLVLYEAPLYVPPKQMRLDLVARFYRQVAAGNIAAAMLTALITSGLAPPFFRLISRSLLEIAIAFVLRKDARQEAREYPPLREVVPTMQYDFNVVSSMQNRFDTFRSVRSDVLLLSCVKSPAYLRESAVALERVLPKARRVEFEELDHSGPWNADRGGKPNVVATAVREFLKAQDYESR